MTKLTVVIFFIVNFMSTIGLAQDATKPNVLFIIVDDLNDYQGVFGGHPQAKTPNIDRLAAQGVQFVNAQTNVPVCSPSRNSMITGVYPHVSKDYGWTDLKKQPVLMHNKTLVRYFKENGYVTLGTGKITHGNIQEDWDEWGLALKNNYGPFYFDGTTKKAMPTVPAPFSEIGQVDGSFGRLSDVGTSSGKRGDKGLVYGWSDDPMRYESDADRDLMQDELHTQWALKKLKELEKRPNQQPFFMGVGYVRPHTPLHAPDKYFDLFPLDEIELDKWLANDEEDTFYKTNFDANDQDNNKGIRYYKSLLASYHGDRELALKSFLQAYLACIAFMDAQVGELLDGLNKSAFKNNTIVVFTSDHGWQMGEKNYLFKNSPWEESVRIPMIIKTQTTKAGTKITQPVSLIDLYPTLVDLCDLKGNHKKNEKAGNLGGFSLKPFLINKALEWKGPNGALTVVGNYGIKIPTEKQNFSYRTKNWRYIRYSNGQEELYNDQTDTYEWYNLAEIKTYQKIKTRLQKEMNKIITKK
ncbi:MAG: sulfatase [Polaribacter sp.]|uniref:sulfatase n=1 Tax=Polaribacter sp. TaxID=1920175 RepID=UPI003BB0459F